MKTQLGQSLFFSPEISKTSFKVFSLIKIQRIMHMLLLITITSFWILCKLKWKLLLKCRKVGLYSTEKQKPFIFKWISPKKHNFLTDLLLSSSKTISESFIFIILNRKSLIIIKRIWTWGTHLLHFFRGSKHPWKRETLVLNFND